VSGEAFKSSIFSLNDQQLENNTNKIRVVADVHQNATERNQNTEAKKTKPKITAKDKIMPLPINKNSNPDAIATISITNEQIMSQQDSVFDIIQVENVDVFDQETTIQYQSRLMSSNSRQFELKSQNLEINNLKMSQLSAAKRSLQTNLFLLSAFVFCFLSVILLPKREVYTIFTSSVMKGLLPIFTTMANFVTIQKVFSHYKASAERKLSNCFIQT